MPAAWGTTRVRARSTTSTWSSSGSTEYLYAGIEYEHDTLRPTTSSATSTACREADPAALGISIKPISEAGSAQIIRYAFQYAKDNWRTR